MSRPFEKLTSQGIVDLTFTFTADASGNWSHEQIQSAAALDAALSARRAAQHLFAIRNMLEAVGRDGIHTVIREQAKEARRLERNRLLRRRRTRARNKRLREAA